MIRSGSLLTRNNAAAAAARIIPTVMTALLLLFLTTPAFSAIRTPAGPESTLQGKVVAVHNMSDLTVLTVKTARGIGNEVNILVAPYTNAKLCGYREHAMDVSPGDSAIIRYHELSGLAIADSIKDKC